MNEEIKSSNILKKLSCSMTENQNGVFEFSENTRYYGNNNGTGDGHIIGQGQVKSDKVVEVERDIEVDDIIADIPGRFVSVLEKRRMERKVQEEMEIDWKSSEKVDDDLIAKFSCSMTENQNGVFEFSENTRYYGNNNGTGDGHSIGQGQVKSDKVVEVERDIEVDDIIADIPGRFVSVLEKRRMERKVEEGMGINWKLSKKVDEDLIASKVESLISKLKNRFSEEKESRKRAIKSDRTHFEFCNSVDAFLRHIERPKIETKYLERDDELQDKGLYNSGFRPVCVRTKRKGSVVESHKSVELDKSLSTENIESNKVKFELVKEVQESHITQFGLAHSPHEVISPLAPLESTFSDDVIRHTMSPEDNSLQPGTDGCSRLTGDIEQTSLKSLKYANFMPLFPSPCGQVLKGRPMFYTGCYRPMMSPRTNYFNDVRRTNYAIIPFIGVIPVRQRLGSIYHNPPLKYFGNHINFFPGHFVINLAAKPKNVFDRPADNNFGGFPVLPAYCMMSFQDGFGRPAFMTVPHHRRNAPGYRLSTNGIPQRKYKNLLGHKETSGRFLPTQNSKNKYQETKMLAPSQLNGHLTNYVPITDDDKKLSADDSQGRDHVKIIDEYEDTGPFGIMSVYCNSKIHLRYDTVKANGL